MGVKSLAKCACGTRVVAKFCAACALQYCDVCCDKRHAKGAFQRHAIVDLPLPQQRSGDDDDDVGDDGLPRVTRADGSNWANDGDNAASVVRLLCEDCGDAAAVLTCDACELRYCTRCADAVHTRGSMQHHRQNGSFQYLRREDQAHGATLLRDEEEKSLTNPSQLTVPSFKTAGASSFFSTIDAQHEDDPDQELSPTPPAKASSLASSFDATGDPWGSWSVRAFASSGSSSGDHGASALGSPPLSGSTDWRSFRSMSIDGNPASPPLSLHEEEEIVPLSAITKSLRSLSFASNEGDMEPQSGKRGQRPRSFSDYTSLGPSKLHDIWNDRVPQLETMLSVQKPSAVTELYKSMKTTVASRHVIIKSLVGGFDSSTLRRVLDALNGFGPVASMRDEFASNGILFCTFFELKAAIGAVKLWFTSNSSASPNNETAAHFALPYETPNDINCATIQVQIHGLSVQGGSAFSDMRQLCSRHGEVASVLERDGDDSHSSRFLIEFNDARDVTAAISRLAGAFLPSGHMITVTRSHPPTLDMAKIQTFKDCVEEAQALPLLGNRPKSNSESTTFLTSPSSTSSSSPLHSSLFEAASSGFAQNNDTEGELLLNGNNAHGYEGSTPITRSSSPFAPALTTTATAWRREPARPRSSSAYASLSSATSSSLLGDGFDPPPARSARYSNPQYPPQYRTPPSAPIHGQQPQHMLLNSGNQPQAAIQGSGRMIPIRSGSDPSFRHSYASSVASSTSSIGRNDQGAGEFSLSIEKVVSGDDKRTTLMVRNIPNKYTQQMLLAEINAHHHGKYDFFYLPIDFKNKCNMGYAFINFIEAESIVTFYQEFDSQKWTNFNSEKVCAISYARLQGKQAMITRFQNSSLLDKHESYRPLVFSSTGPNRGKPEPFPSPKPQTHHQHPQHQHHHQPHHYANKKFPYPAQPQHALAMSSSDEYLLAAHTGRLYAHQHQQYVLHGHALLANAHAAAAAMLHNMPGLGMPTTPLPAQYAQQQHRAYPYPHHGYQPQGVERRHGQPTFVNGGSSSRVSSGGAAFGAFNSAAPSFTPSSSSSA